VTTDDNAQAVLALIRAYLSVEFEGAQISAMDEPRTGNVIFHVREPVGNYRLLVTQRYRDGDDGVDAAINNLVRWGVAEMMRQSGGSIIILETTGARLAHE